MLTFFSLEIFLCHSSQTTNIQSRFISWCIQCQYFSPCIQNNFPRIEFGEPPALSPLKIRQNSLILDFYSQRGVPKVYSRKDPNHISQQCSIAHAFVYFYLLLVLQKIDCLENGFLSFLATASSKLL